MVPEVKVLDCCAEWMSALQICETLAPLSNEVHNKRAVPAGKCRRRLAYGRLCVQASAAPGLTLITQLFKWVSIVQI